MFNILIFCCLPYIATCVRFPEHDSEGESVAEAAVSVGLYLPTMAGKELGVDQLQSYFSKTLQELNNEPPDNAKTLAVALAAGLRNKLDDVVDILNRAAARIETSLGQVSSQVDYPPEALPVTPCCATKRRSMASLCDASVDSDQMSDAKSRNLSAIREIFDENRRRSDIFVRQFFFADFGKFFVESPSIDRCAMIENLTSRRRQIWSATIHPDRKNVLIILERGADQTGNQLNLGRSVALHLLRMLTANDKVGLVTVSNVEAAEVVEKDDCRLEKLTMATKPTKMAIERHLKQIHHAGNASRSFDVTAGFEVARKLVKNSALETSEAVHVMFISPWRNKNKKVWSEVLKIVSQIRSENKMTSIIFDVYHLTNDAVGGADEVASFEGADRVVYIDSTTNMAEKVGDPFQFLAPNNLASLTKIFDVDIDPVGVDEVVLTVAQTVTNLNAVFGVDIPFDRLFQDFIHLPRDSYQAVTVSVVDKSSGYFVYHPYLLDRVNSKMSSKIGQIHFGQFESEKLLRLIVENSSGNLTSTKSTHVWHRVTDTNYVVVVSTSLTSETSPNGNVNLTPLTSTAAKLPQIFFHRLDVLTPKQQSKLCRHFFAPATLESGSLFVSNDAFFEPWDRPRTVRSQTIESYLAYLTDKTSLISNPGFRSGVRDEVLKIALVTPTWKNMSYDSGLNNYIVRRFAATSSGVYYVYPGTPSSQDFEPSRQDWFEKSTKFPDRVLMTPPRLDPGGSGYIVSLSQAVQSNRHGAVVVGMDLTLGYVYKLVFETLPLCRNDSVRCFLFDDEGYLVVHPDMFLIGEGVAHQHLTYKEPLVAGDIFRHSTLARKKSCARYSDETVQRFYSFNVSYDKILSNTLKDSGMSSDADVSCSKYRVSAIHGTNLFIGIVEPASHCAMTAAAFCPCSVEDQWCILCDGKESLNEDETTCECPCQCSFNNIDRAGFCPKQDFLDEPVCPPEVQRPDVVSHLSRDVLMTSLPLPPCFERDCGRRATKESCLGVIGCSWCEKEASSVGGKTQPLKVPYCGEMSRCFFGILGAKSPYIPRTDDAHSGGRSLLRDVSQNSHDDFFFGNPTSSIGPIAGGIVGCFMFLAISVCCLRGQPKCSIISALGGATIERNDSSLRVSHLEEDPEDEEKGEELQELSGHADILRVCPVASEAVSPYQMNPTYRRPPPGTDSDHGYSTMTPLGGDIDSEILHSEIVPYTESASARDRLRRRPGMPSSLHSVTSGMSSRTASPIHVVASRFGPENSGLLSDTSEAETPTRGASGIIGQQTQLAKHQFIVAATVHREEVNQV